MEKKKKIDIPLLDVVVGNPPYTEHEELEDYFVDYKEKLQNVLKTDWGKELNLGLKAGFYAYFFLHGLKFLKGNGRFGYITSNSWLDVDYGKHLQKFFLDNCKIIAIIEPKERVFPDAAINTVITILQKSKKKEDRDNNFVKFVKLKVDLEKLIPKEEGKRWEFLDNFINLIETIEKNLKAKTISAADKSILSYEDDKIIVKSIKQSELYEEGYDNEKKKYLGSKWSRYIRAPEVFFKKIILKKPFIEIFDSLASIGEGEPTGENKFFYLDESKIKRFAIEKEFITKSIRSPKNINEIIIDDKKLKYYKLTVDKSLKKLKKRTFINILFGVKEKDLKEYFKKDTWYIRSARRAPILLTRGVWNRHIAFLNNNIGVASDRFIEIFPKINKSELSILTLFLNSSVMLLIIELYGRTTLGLGTLDVQPIDIRKIPIINPTKLPKNIHKKIKSSFDNFLHREILTVFEEIGASSPDEVSLNKVKPDRRELDKIVMGEILGLTEGEQLEVYRAVVKLVKDRIERARSVEKRKKIRGADPEALAEGILREIDTSKLKKFPDDYLGDNEYEVKRVPEGVPKEIVFDLKSRHYALNIDEKKVGFPTKEEAEYIMYAILNGVTSVKIPKNKKLIKDIVGEYRTTYKKVQNEINIRLQNYIPDRKLREKVKIIIGKRIF